METLTGEVIFGGKIWIIVGPENAERFSSQAIEAGFDIRPVPASRFVALSDYEVILLIERLIFLLDSIILYTTFRINPLIRSIFDTLAQVI